MNGNPRPAAAQAAKASTMDPNFRIGRSKLVWVWAVAGPHSRLHIKRKDTVWVMLIITHC